MGCVEFEAGFRIFAIVILLAGIFNAFYSLTIGKLFIKNKESVLNKTNDLSSLYKYGVVVVGIARIISASSIYLWLHPLKFLFNAMLFFIASLYLPSLICH